MSWNGSLVVDGVAHAYTFGADNRRPDCPPAAYDGLVDWIHGFLHAPLEAREPDAREAPFFSCRVPTPPLVLTDARHPVRFDGESLAVVWLPVDRAPEVAP